MWNKCTDRMPTKDGIYLTVERFNGHNIYRIAAYRKNLGNVFGLDEYSGKSGFYDSDPEWGSFVIEPEAWKWIERYREKEKTIWTKKYHMTISNVNMNGQKCILKLCMIYYRNRMIVITFWIYCRKLFSMMTQTAMGIAYMRKLANGWSGKKYFGKEEVIMAKFHEAPCKYYLNEGNCEKGRDGTYRSYCQKCSKYEPRKGYVPKPNKKKEDKWKFHGDE